MFWRLYLTNSDLAEVILTYRANLWNSHFKTFVLGESRARHKVIEILGPKIPIVRFVIVLGVPI